MVLINFNTFYLVLIPILSILYTCINFFLINKTNSAIQENVNVEVQIKPQTTKSVGLVYSYIIIYTYLYISTIHGASGVILFNHLSFTNTNMNILYIFTVVGLTICFVLQQIHIKNNLKKSLDYIFSLSMLFVILPYLFFTNTVFTFLFFLEFISIVLFLKLISSNLWFSKKNQQHSLINNIPQNYINMVFFQY